jgi:hypothetical protein
MIVKKHISWLFNPVLAHIEIITIYYLKNKD